MSALSQTNMAPRSLHVAERTHTYTYEIIYLGAEIVGIRICSAT